MSSMSVADTQMVNEGHMEQACFIYLPQKSVWQPTASLNSFLSLFLRFDSAKEVV